MKVSVEITDTTKHVSYNKENAKPIVLANLQEMIQYYGKEKQKLELRLVMSLANGNNSTKIYKKISVFTAKLLMINYFINANKEK